VDGVDAIRLAGHGAMPHTTLWVDPATYLPVRLTTEVQALRAHPTRKAFNTTATVTVDYRWLAPTRANLTVLTAPIPKGFTLAELPLPVPKQYTLGMD
jgi:hypothetical protein